MGVNRKYFLLSGSTKTFGNSIAYAPEEVELAHELISTLEGQHVLPFEYELKKESNDNLKVCNELSKFQSVWLDYLPNSLAWPLMSEKLKNVIDNIVSGEEGIEWILCKVNSSTEHKNYYVPRFTKELDVLDVERTMYVPGTDQIIKPTYSQAKIRNLFIFYKPSFFWQITHSIYVAEELKRLILKEKLTGIEFEKTSVV